MLVSAVLPPGTALRFRFGSKHVFDSWRFFTIWLLLLRYPCSHVPFLAILSHLDLTKSNPVTPPDSTSWLSQKIHTLSPWWFQSAVLPNHTPHTSHNPSQKAGLLTFILFIPRQGAFVCSGSTKRMMFARSSGTEAFAFWICTSQKTNMMGKRKLTCKFSMWILGPQHSQRLSTPAHGNSILSSYSSIEVLSLSNKFGSNSSEFGSNHFRGLSLWRYVSN